MKKILVYAYLENNFGDDLFVKILCERYSGKQFYIAHQAKKNQSLLKVPNLKFVNKSLSYCLNHLMHKSKCKWKNILKLPAIIITELLFKLYFSCTVFITGSGFMEDNIWHQEQWNPIEYWIRFSKQFFIISANFGPYYSKGYLEYFSHCFSSVADVCWREEYSYKLFSNKHNMRYAPDAAFNVKFPSITGNKKTALISLIDCNNKQLNDYTNIYETKMTELIRYLISLGYSVKLISLCEKEGDEFSVTRVLKKLDNDITNDKSSYYYYKGNIEETIKIFSEAEVVVATRFHAMIMGWVGKKRTLPIVYSSKQLHVINELYRDSIYCSIKDIQNINMANLIDELLAQDIKNFSQIIKQSKEQFRALDKALC